MVTTMTRNDAQRAAGSMLHSPWTRVITKLYASVIVAMLFVPTAVRGSDEPVAESPAVGGYCVVSYFTANKATKGDAKFTSKYFGETYWLADEKAKQAFEKEPAKYVPQYGGLCTTALGGSYGNRLPSDPTVFDVRDGKLYLFSQERAKRAYDKNPAQYIKKANDLFSRPTMGGKCPVMSQKEKSPVAADVSITGVYHSQLYAFATAEARDEFARSPERYAPRFDGFCAVGVSANKKFLPDGTRLRVVNDRTYLLFDVNAEQEFERDTAGVIQRAEANWPALKNKK